MYLTSLLQCLGHSRCSKNIFWINNEWTEWITGMVPYGIFFYNKGKWMDWWIKEWWIILHSYLDKTWNRTFGKIKINFQAPTLHISNLQCKFIYRLVKCTLNSSVVNTEKHSFKILVQTQWTNFKEITIKLITHFFVRWKFLYPRQPQNSSISSSKNKGTAHTPSLKNKSHTDT